MGLFGSINSALRNYSKFKGRASRSEYWYWQLAISMPLLVSIQISDSVFAFVFMLVFIPTLALAWRRAHDCNLPGLLMLIPLVREVISLLPSRPELNKYGPPPPPRFTIDDV